MYIKKKKKNGRDALALDFCDNDKLFFLKNVYLSGNQYFKNVLCVYSFV